MVCMIAARSLGIVAGIIAKIRQHTRQGGAVHFSSFSHSQARHLPFEVTALPLAASIAAVRMFSIFAATGFDASSAHMWRWLAWVIALTYSSCRRILARAADKDKAHEGQ